MVMAQTHVQTRLTSQRSGRDWPFKVKPLHPVLGCEITDITLAEAVSPALFAKVYEAFLTYELILFRDVDLPPATQVAFARNFGEVQVHVHLAEIARKSNLGRRRQIDITEQDQFVRQKCFVNF